MRQVRLTEEDLKAWTAHPVSEVVLGFLKEFAADIRAQWSRGENWTEEARAAVQIYEDVANISLEDIKSFYEEPDEQDDS